VSLSGTSGNIAISDSGGEGRACDRRASVRIIQGYSRQLQLHQELA
jgi:hypothetical protein